MYLKVSIVSLLFSLFFSACSSKNDISLNNKINSISLNKKVIIASVPRTVKSPISIGLGIGGYVFRHVGIHVGTSVRPDISNDDALVLQRAIQNSNVSLSNLISNEFDSEMKNDSFYKNRYVPFGSEYTISLYVPKYYLDEATFSSKAIVKIFINAKIYDSKNQLVYETNHENDSSSKDFVFSKNEILSSKEFLTKALQNSIKNSVSKIIFDMKKQ